MQVCPAKVCGHYAHVLWYHNIPLDRSGKLATGFRQEVCSDL